MIIGALVDLGVPVALLQKGWEAVGGKGKVEVLEVSRRGIKGKKVRVQLPPVHFEPAQMRKLIVQAPVPERAKEVALKALDLLEEAERKVHGRAEGFHELGDPDTLFDLLCAGLALDFLCPDEVYCSPIPLSRGEVISEHGPLPSPAPATLELLKGVPVYPFRSSIENVTPTGVALLRAMADGFGEFPEMVVDAVGYGAGDLDPPGIPNLLRAILGKATEVEDDIWVLEADLDDLNPEFLPYLEERLREAGVRDVGVYPLKMKKGRLGCTVRCLVEAPLKDEVIGVFFQESTTLGIRGWRAKRWVLEREVHEVLTPYGSVKIKVGKAGERVITFSPEYESCKSLAQSTKRPLKEIYGEAVKAFLESEGESKRR